MGINLSSSHFPINDLKNSIKLYIVYIFQSLPLTYSPTPYHIEFLYNCVYMMPFYIYEIYIFYLFIYI